MNNIGRTVGIYFYIIAFVQLLAVLINLKVAGDININLSFIIFITVGYFLMKHNQRVRKITMYLSGFLMFLQIGIFIYFVSQGVPEGWKIQILGISFDGNHRYIILASFMSTFIPGIPFFLLRSKKAIEEFKTKNITLDNQ